MTNSSPLCSPPVVARTNAATPSDADFTMVLPVSSPGCRRVRVIDVTRPRLLRSAYSGNATRRQQGPLGAGRPEAVNIFILLVACFLIGMLLRRSGRLPANAHAALNGFVIHISLPALTLLYV